MIDNFLPDVIKVLIKELLHYNNNRSGSFKFSTECSINYSSLSLQHFRVFVNISSFIKEKLQLHPDCQMSLYSHFSFIET